MQRISELTEKLVNLPLNSEQPSKPCEPKKDCEICGGLGWYRLNLPIDHPNFGKAIRCDCKKQEDIQYIQKICGLTETEQKIRLSNIKANGQGTKLMLTIAKTFLEKPVGIVTFIGTYGNGKTTTLIALVNELVARGIEAVYITAFTLLSYIREAYHKHDDSAYERLSRFEKVRVLAIDELDKATPFTDWELKQITDLIDWRHRLAESGTAGTLFALNSIEGLPEWIMSRLRQGEIVINNDLDFRKYLRK